MEAAALAPQALQDEQEITEFVSLLRAEGVESYLEIGAKFGGSFFRVGLELPDGSRMVAVDLESGTKAWPESKKSLLEVAEELRKRHFVEVVWGDSTDPKIIERVRNLGPFDAILIDANHTLPYVEKDWANYSGMGKIVAFHDIGWRRADTWEGIRIDVPRMWERLKGQHTKWREIKLDGSGKNNGIGVVWTDSHLYATCD